MTEWHASAYSKEASLQKELAEKQLAQLKLNGDERVLDVGCGDGKITAEIAARVSKGSVLGVDPSSEMIAFAQNHFAPPKFANLKFQVADVRQLSTLTPALSQREREKSYQFDLVVSFNALHWVPEQAQALNSIRASLKPTGRAVLRFVPQGERTCLEDVIEQTREKRPLAAIFWKRRLGGSLALPAWRIPLSLRALHAGGIPQTRRASRVQGRRVAPGRRRLGFQNPRGLHGLRPGNLRRMDQAPAGSRVERLYYRRLGPVSKDRRR